MHYELNNITMDINKITISNLFYLYLISIDVCSSPLGKYANFAKQTPRSKSNPKS